MTTPSCRVYMDARLVPQCASGASMRGIVLGMVIAASLVLSLIMFAAGAFPVIGFFGIDILIFALAISWHARSLVQETRVLITADTIMLSHYGPGRKQRKVRLPTALTQIDMDPCRQRTNRLRLTHAGRAWMVGDFLTPEERKSLKQALERAVGEARMERYP